MKTKNIFRMLLVAAALLLGANNVKAEEVTIWQGDQQYLELDYLKFQNKGIAEGTILRMYADTGGNVQVSINNTVYWQSEMSWGTAWGTESGDQTYYYNNCYNYVLTAAQASDLVSYGIVFNTGNKNAKKVTIENVSTDNRSDITLSFGQTTWMDITNGQTDVAGPTLTLDPTGLGITYESSSESVATIANDGKVSAVAPGVTTITASFAGNDTYKPKSASYYLVVKHPFTVTPEGTQIWTGSVYFGDWQQTYGTFATIDSNNLSNVNVGDDLRFYCTLETLNNNYWQLQINYNDNGWQSIDTYNPNKAIDNSNPNVKYSITNGYIQIKVTEDMLNKGNLFIQGENLTLYRVTHVVAQQPEQTINGNWTATSTVPEAGATIKDDDALTISTVYATTGGNDSRQIHGVAFNQFIKVRTEAAPSADNVTGTQRTDCTPITITAKRNTTVVFYYRRQADNGSTDWSFTSNDSKDLKLVDQSAPTTVINGTLSVNNAIYNDGVYGYVAKTYTLEAGKTYTVWATGTTIQLYGIYYSTNASNVQVNTTYKITYYNGENVYCAIWLPSGATIPSLDTDPSLEGYTFDGWKDGSGNNLPSTMPANDLTVYAQFSQNGQQEPSYIEVNMGNYEFRTYVTTTNIDFSQSIGIKGYYASSANNSEVELTEITGIVASNVPLLLRKVSGATDYKLRVADTEGTVPSPNLLVAGSNANVSGSNCYVLTFHNGLVFAEVNNESAYVDSEHAYLRVSGSNARGHLKVRFNDNGTAGIKDIESGEQGAKVIYDLRGQRVERPTKGIYIINGKKTVIK